jgi:hypothetical protein
VAKDDTAIPAMFQLPARTLGALAPEPPVGCGAVRVEIPPGVRQIDMAAVGAPPQDIPPPEDGSGGVCVLSSALAAGGFPGGVRRLAVPLLSPDVLAYDASLDLLTVAGGTNRVLAAIPHATAEGAWAIPLVLDRTYGAVKGVAFREAFTEGAVPLPLPPRLQLLLAVPQAVKDKHTAAIFSAGTTECDLQLHDFAVLWPPCVEHRPGAVEESNADAASEVLHRVESGAYPDPLGPPGSGPVELDVATVMRLRNVEQGIQAVAGAVDVASASQGIQVIGERRGVCDQGRTLPAQPPVVAGTTASLEERTEARVAGLESGMSRIEAKLDALCRHLGCQL